MIVQTTNSKTTEPLAIFTAVTKVQIKVYLYLNLPSASSMVENRKSLDMTPYDRPIIVSSLSAMHGSCVCEILVRSIL